MYVRLNGATYICFSTGSAQNTLAQPVVWMTIALAIVICIAPVVTFRFLKLNLKPQLSDSVSQNMFAVITYQVQR